MEARYLPRAGKQVFVRDLLVSSEWLDESLSVIGRLDEHDITHCRVRLVDPKTQHSLLVDTRLVEPFDARTGSLFQFMGEMRADDSTGYGKESVVLQARIVRCCDGLDLPLYEHALKTQRDFFQNRPKNLDGSLT